MAFSDLGLSQEFLTELEGMEANIHYKTQDLVFALLKVKKYHNKHYEQLYNDLTEGKIKFSLK